MIRTIAIATLLLATAAIASACDVTDLGATPVGPSEGALGSPSVSPSAVPSPTFVRPTPTPLPTFLVHVVQRGDTLTSIAKSFGTTAQSLAYWNRATYPTLDPESGRYAPNSIKAGWLLRLIPYGEVDPEDLPPADTPAPTPAASTP